MELKTGSLCVVITGPTLSQVRKQIEKANSLADLMELRLDLYTFNFFENLPSLQAMARRPLIFTLRSRSHGGSFAGEEQERLEQLCRLAAFAPPYLDVEHGVDGSLLKELMRLSPETGLLCTYHNLFSTPQELDSLLDAMENPYSKIYKIATHAQSSLDALRMIEFAKRRQGALIGCCLGERGIATRLLAAHCGNKITYCALSEEERAAPGQFTIEEICRLYRYRSITAKTAVIGLIGAHLSLTPSHKLHNSLFAALGLDALYIKFPLEPWELDAFVEQAAALGFRGLAVTMPHKEKIVERLTAISREAQELGAVNTVAFIDGKAVGANTDGRGAADAIEAKMMLKGKKMVLLGAGGAAKAVAYEAHKRGASLVILNRNVDEAVELAAKYGGSGGSLSEVPADYDLLVNATPVGMCGNHLPIAAEAILPGTLVMDLIAGNSCTPLLNAARARGCETLDGDVMLRLQAIGQYELWFGIEPSIVHRKLQQDENSYVNCCS